MQSADKAAMRDSMDLGTAATTDATDYATSAQGDLADSALQPTGDGSALTGITPTQVGLGNVTNDAQTKAAIVPNTAPAAGDFLVGNAGGTAYAKVAMSGDATLASAGALTIANGAVTNVKMADMAASTFKMRVTGSTGAPEDGSATQATAALNVMVGDSGSGGTKGLVPAPAAGDATKFLTGAGTYSTPAGSGDVVGPNSSTDNALARFDSTTGKLLQNGQITQSNGGDLENVNTVVLDDIADPSYAAGTLFFSSAKDCFAYFNSNSGVTICIGQTVMLRVVNNTGGTLDKGTPVYINGNDTGTNLATVAKAKADAYATAIAAGVVSADITNTSTGYVTVVGLVDGLNTNAFNNGDQLYVSDATAGTLTATAPAAPNYRVDIGVVTKKAGGTSGHITVTPSTILLGLGSANQFRAMNSGGTGEGFISAASAAALLRTYLFRAEVGGDVASASTIDLTAATGGIVDVTGTTTITAITLAAGQMQIVRFTGVLTLTHGGSLVLPGAANITTAAGAYAMFVGYAAGVVRCAFFQRANGQAVVKPDVMTGDSGSGGVSGLVPSPAAGDAAVGRVLAADGTWKTPKSVSRAESGTSFTLALTDANSYIRLTNASPCTITLPLEATVAWTADTEIIFRIAAAGIPTFSTSATINNVGAVATMVQHNTFAIKKVGTNIWDLI